MKKEDFSFKDSSILLCLDCGYNSPKLCYKHSRDLDLCSEYSEPENPDCGEDFSDLCSKCSEQGLGLKLFYEINMTGIPIYRDPTRCDEGESVKKQIEKRIKTELVGKFFSIVRDENVNSNIYIKFLNCKCSVSNKLGHKISFDSKNFKNQVSKLFTRNNPGCTAAL